ncbi:MAG: hypothetical protein ACJ789_14380 [Thermomicrobiales bacterium]
MEHIQDIYKRHGAGWSNRFGDHTILIPATVMPLILMVLAHGIRERNSDSIVGWYVGSLLTYGMAWVVWQRTNSRVTRGLVILVISLWMVYDGFMLIALSRD